MVGQFAWMKQEREDVPGEDSSQVKEEADSVDLGGEVGEVTPEVKTVVLCEDSNCSMYF